MAARELKNALEAQMQAKIMLERNDDDDGHLKGDSSQLDNTLGTGSLMECSATNLVRLQPRPRCCGRILSVGHSA
jgi:hypothetical protein